MRLLGIGLLASALLLAVFAVVYQARDVVTGHGGTMGAEMTAGLVWTLAALLGGLGSLVLFGGYAAASSVVAVLALSFLIRTWIPRLLSTRRGRRRRSAG